MITLMKASAGSGKTFLLTKTYISLLLATDDPHAYRHILAVTFTNKATDEMKTRILKELHILSTNTASSPYLEEFVPSRFPTAAILQKRAKEVLVNLLHDYSAFSVSTIDGFFQQTLKAFSKEIGQFSSYKVELDKNSLVAESVDRVLDSLSEEQPELLSWLKESVMTKLEQGQKYNMDNQLLSIAKGVKSDQRRRLVEKYGIDEKKTTSRANLKKTEKALRQEVSDFAGSVRNAAKAVKEGFEACGMDMYADTTSKLIGGSVGKCLNVRDGEEIPMPTASFQKKHSDYTSWFRKPDQAKFACNESVLFPLVEAFAALFNGTAIKVYNTSRALLAQIHDFGIIAELNAEYDALLKEKNIMCLDDSNTILRDIIDGSDAPFVYEKLGVRYDHFLLDEFQDTSKVQWENFRPLVEESHSKEGHNLLVGDIKQSIYRWRGSDWDLMAKDVPAQLPDIVHDSLKYNFRSLDEVVGFNNRFFKFCANQLDRAYGISGDRIPIADIYSDVKQIYRKGEKGDGSVEVLFTDGDDQRVIVYNKVVAALEAGAKNSDIAILVRKNKQGAAIASYLLSNGIPVISDEALHVKGSVTVRRLASLMSYVNSPGDTVGSYLAGSLGLEFDPKGYLSLVDMAEGILRQLRDSDQKAFDGEIQYIQAFMDCLQDYSNIDGNNLSGFLKWWDGADPSIGSPSGADAVKIMTIHKSKGLQFPYVIIPFAEETELFDDNDKWSHPDVAGTSLEGVVEDVYQVRLSGKSANTLFENEYREEEYLQHIDALNTFYVALTRAEKGLCIISDKPSDKATALAFYLREFVSVKDLGHPDMELDEEELKSWTPFEMTEVDGMERFFHGRPCDYGTPAKQEDSSSELWPCLYPSTPLNPGNIQRSRLKIKSDSADFFSEDGEVGTRASGRLKGIVLHDILSGVRVPSDLEKAVRGAVARGELSLAEAAEAYDLLKERIESAVARGWFPDDPSKVCNEASIADTDGTVHRPDRVVFTETGGVIVIDYKFGAHHKKYRDQVNKYAELYRNMGYKDVSSALWYVKEDKVLL